MGDIIFFTDNDLSPCKARKFDKINKILKNIKREKIQIVIEEIESWYIAGLSRKDQEKLCIKYQHTTDNLTKEDFEKFISNEFDSIEALRVEVLRYFDISIAKKRNKSFKYFVEKYIETPKT
ncbi:MAG: hypothetical protein ACLFSQ_02905 [Candidatus Zixiibacteriota bacterium]